MWRVLTPAFLVMLAIGFGTTRLAEQAVESELEDRLDRLGDHAAKLISFRLDSIVENARGLSRNELLINGLIDTQSRGDYLPPFFNSLQIPGLKEATIRLTDYRGRTIVANRRDLDETHDPDWIEKVLNGQEYFTFTRDHLHIAVPVFYNGMPEGALSVKFKSSSIAKQFSIGWENSIALVNDEGIIVYSSNPDFASHGMIAPGNTQVPKWIINRRLIPNQPALSLLSAIEESRAFSSLGRLRDSLSIVIIFNLAALAIAISFAAFLTTHALKGMIETIRQIGGAEDLNKTIETKGPAEMQELGQTFNTMIERLQKTTTSRDFVDSIINSMNEILIVTSMSGTIQTSNPAAKRFLRENKKSAVKTITETLSGNEHIDWDTIQPFLNDRTQDTKYESAYISNEESPKYILWSKSFLKKKNGQLDGMVFVGQDITEHKKIDRLKNEFVSVVSHELRTPLTSIAGSLKLMASGATGTLQDKHQHLVDIALRNSNRLVRLINDILDLQKIEAGGMDINPEKLILTQVIRQALEANQGFAEKDGISFEFQESIGDAIVSADKDKLMQVLTNLLSNAIKYSPEGGTVTVGADFKRRELLISIHDQGPGISESFHNNIFQKFAQADSSDTRKKEGTGLGLAIAKSIVELMGGKIWFETQPEAGTTFYFTLPEQHNAGSPKSPTAPLIRS